MGVWVQVLERLRSHGEAGKSGSGTPLCHDRSAETVCIRNTNVHATPGSPGLPGILHRGGEENKNYIWKFRELKSKKEVAFYLVGGH